MTLKNYYQYRKLNRKADRQGDCLQCKEQYLNARDQLRCPVVEGEVMPKWTCNKWRKK